LVRTLASAGRLPDPAWRAAFAAVPRHAFLPRFFTLVGGGRSAPRWAAVAAGDPGWLDQVYVDDVLVTQLDGDPGRWAVARESGPVPGVPTCSSSQPAIMAIMLSILDVAPGLRVLEIGTGTGYNAALLSHRLGDGNVTSVDIDADLSATARTALAECGYAPTCLATDGAEGHAAGAPYDRVLATCSVARIPLPWLAQTAPGGLIVTTLHRPLGSGLLKITAGDGPTGEGRVLAENGRFMPLRAHQITGSARPDRTDGDTRPTDMGAAALADPRSGFDFYAGLVLPEAAMTTEDDGSAWLLHPDGSWARYGDHTVAQGGPRRLWDIVETAHADWLSLGRPTRDRFGITVTPEHQYLWLDSRDSQYRWPL
jgi:methyltransferase of ATP-grasp peptide maturase system